MLDMNRYSFLAGVAALSIVLTACSSSSNSPSSSTGNSASAGSSTGATGITISGFAFSGTLKVKAGQKVTVTNKDSAAHTLTDKATHLFDTGNIPGNGGTGTFTAPKKPGSYKFGCTYHPQMAGTLIVTA